MIKFNDISKDDPYIKFVELYNLSIENKQSSIEACCISSFNAEKQEVNSRFVNLKYINLDKWYFYSNYNSPKSIEFLSHDQISCVFYWNSINSQIRMKAKIFEAPKKESDEYFSNRSFNKNILAISSQQSEVIESYEAVEKNFNITKNIHSQNSALKRPSYWGGYYFIPYYFEFWKGHQNRLNKREIFQKKDKWIKHFLQP